jgi:hypothetical protein
MNIESQAATSLVLESYGLSLLFLTCRIMKGSQSLSSLMQIFGILKNLETLKLLNLIDLCTWRAIFVACDEFIKNESSKFFSLKNTAATSTSTMICILYDLLSAMCVDEFISSDIYILEIYSRNLKKMKYLQLTPSTSSEHTLPCLDLGYPSEQIGLIWFSHKLCDYKKKFHHILSPTQQLHSPSKERNRPRSNSVPTSLGSSPLPTSPLAQPTTMWQRFKSRKSISIEDESDRLVISEKTIDEILNLETNSSLSIFSFKTFRKSNHWITIATEVNNTEEEEGEVEGEEDKEGVEEKKKKKIELQKEIELTTQNLENKIQNWRNVTKLVVIPNIEKGERVFPFFPFLTTDSNGWTLPSLLRVSLSLNLNNSFKTKSCHRK